MASLSWLLNRTDFQGLALFKRAMLAHRLKPPLIDFSKKVEWYPRLATRFLKEYKTPLFPVGDPLGSISRPISRNTKPLA